MNRTRKINAEVSRIVVVLVLPRTPADAPARAVLVDGVFRWHGEIIELDAGDGLSLIQSGRARRATHEEAAAPAVIVAKTHSKGNITSSDFIMED